MRIDNTLHKYANVITLTKELNEKLFPKNEYFKDFKCKIDKHGNLNIIDKTNNDVFLKGVPVTRLSDDDAAYTTKVIWYDAETKQKLEMSPAVYGKPGNGTYEKAMKVIEDNIRYADDLRSIER